MLRISRNFETNEEKEVGLDVAAQEE